jgi:hypothetical protein
MMKLIPKNGSCAINLISTFLLKFYHSTDNSSLSLTMVNVTLINDLI